MIDLDMLIINISQYLNSDQTLLYKWQDLFGSVVGVIGASMVAILGFYLRYVWNSSNELRESTRKTEIALALTLHNIYDVESHLKDFIVRVNKAIVKPIKNTPAETYFIGGTNFPSVKIHVDNDLIKSRFKSYYVHNKLLIIHKKSYFSRHEGIF